MNLRDLRDALYTVPIVGSVVLYRDLKRQNTLLEQRLASTQLESEERKAVRSYIRKPFFETSLHEIVPDFWYTIWSNGLLMSDPKMPWALALGLFYILPGLVLSYRSGRHVTEPIRNYDQTGMLEIVVPTFKEVTTKVPAYRTIEL